MPRFQMNATAQPTSMAAFQAPVVTPQFPPYVSLWFEGGVLWGINQNNPLDSLPIAFSGSGAFKQCMKINISNAHNLKFGAGAGPYGNSFHVASWSVKTPSKRHCAWIATSLSSYSMIWPCLKASGWNDGNLIFPACCFLSVTANSPSGNVTIPHLPLILVSPNSGFKTILAGAGGYPAYFQIGY